MHFVSYKSRLHECILRITSLYRAQWLDSGGSHWCSCAKALEDVACTTFPQKILPFIFLSQIYHKTFLQAQREKIPPTMGSMPLDTTFTRPKDARISEFVFYSSYVPGCHITTLQIHEDCNKSRVIHHVNVLWVTTSWKPSSQIYTLVITVNTGSDEFRLSLFCRLLGRVFFAYGEI